MHRLLRWVRISVKIALAVSGAVLVARAAFGPFQLFVPVRNPIGAESVFGVSAVLGLVLLAATGGGSNGNPDNAIPPYSAVARSQFPWHAAAIAVVCGFAAWAWTLRFPFVADDYIHTWNALHATAAYLGGLFTVPAADHFFRPFGYLAFAAEAPLFGLNRIGWHAFSLCLHVLTGLLVYHLARALRTGTYAALAAMLYFLLHGSRPEAVAWVSAQFDLWAALFVLAALAAFLRYRETRRVLWQAASLAALLCGLLSKESAYVYPLILILWLRLHGAKWRESIMQAVPPLALTVVVFAYRVFLLGGIGGYRDATNGATFFFNLSLVRTAKGLLARSAAITMFPINWSAANELWLIAGVVAALLVMLAVAVREPFGRRVDRNRIWFGLGFFLLCALPVHLFLLIDADLEKSRVLYLPMAGAALALAAVLEALRKTWAVALAAAILLFQAAALQHNLEIWARVSELAENTCASAAREVARAPGLVRMTGIPNVVDGIYFLHTGFRRCVEQAAGVEALPLLTTDTDPTTAPAVLKVAADERVQSYRWDAQLRHLVEDDVPGR